MSATTAATSGDAVAAAPTDEETAIIQTLAAVAPPSDQKDAAVQAKNDLEVNHAHGGNYWLEAEALGAAREAKIRNRQDGTSAAKEDELRDELLLYLHGLAQAAKYLTEAEETVEAAEDPLPSFLSNEFAPSMSDDDELCDVHLALPACALVRLLKCDAAKLENGDIAAWEPVTEQLARESPLRGGTYKVVWGTAVAACPMMLLHYESTDMRRSVLIVVVKSTANAVAWLRNLCIELVDVPLEWHIPSDEPHGAQKQKVHAGFRAVVNGFKLSCLDKEIQGKLVDHEENGLVGTQMKVVFAGHSLGAAVATLLAARHGTRDNPARLVTFGGPRVGNDALQTAIQRLTVHTRVATPGDPVPGLPCWWRHNYYAPALANAHWALHPPADDDVSAAAVMKTFGTDATASLTNVLSCSQLRRFLVEHPMHYYLERMLLYYNRL